MPLCGKNEQTWLNLRKRRPRNSTEGSSSLERVLSGTAGEQGQQDDPAVEQQRPVLDVIEIVQRTAFDLGQGRGVAAIAVDLGPAGDAGADALALRIKLEFVV